MTRILLAILLVLSALTVASKLARTDDRVVAGAPPPDDAALPAQPAPAPREPVAIPPAPLPEPPAPVAIAPSATPTIARLARLESIRRLHQSGRYTYLDSMLTTSDSLVRRWPDRPRSPLRVARAPLPDSLSSHAPRANRALSIALDRWAALGVAIGFAPARDSSDADIVVRWIDRFDTDRSGQADIQFGGDGAIVGAQVTLALTAPDARPLTDRELGVVATHEIGHALGLPHSARPADVMYPTARLDGISDRDRATLTLLYALRPGPLRDPAAP